MLRVMRMTIVLAGLALAGSDAAGIIIPSARYSSIPGRVVLVGLSPAGPDVALGSFVVHVRSTDDQPLENSAVQCELPASSDFRFAAVQADPQMVVLCGERLVFAYTDDLGAVSMVLLGGGRAPLGPLAATNRMAIYADGVPLGTASVTCHDLDGVNGVNLADLAFWARDYFSNTHPDRADFDGDGTVTIADLSRWANVYFAGASAQSPPAYCP